MIGNALSALGILGPMGLFLFFYILDRRLMKKRYAEHLAARERILLGYNQMKNAMENYMRYHEPVDEEESEDTWH